MGVRQDSDWESDWRTGVPIRKSDYTFASDFERDSRSARSESFRDDEQIKFLILKFITTMQTRFLKVIAQTEPIYVQSRKNENSQMAKSYIRLRELGGEYEDEYQCTLLGPLAECRFPVGTVVAASLRFRTHENGGNWYQDIVVNEIVPVK